MQKFKITISKTPEELGNKIADIVMSFYKKTGRLVLGMPWGSTPIPFFNSFADLVKRHDVDLSRFHLVMMDEYVVANNGVYSYVSESVPYSGHYKLKIDFLDKLPPRAVREINIHFPSLDKPESFDKFIKGNLGGIDLFLVATGADDGHVAMCGPGTPLESHTRIIKVPETVREYNFHKYVQAFNDNIENVPRWGISIGLRTILDAKKLLFVAHGSEKAQIVNILCNAKKFDKNYPVTFLWNAVEKTELYVDSAAAEKIKNIIGV